MFPFQINAHIVTVSVTWEWGETHPHDAFRNTSPKSVTVSKTEGITSLENKLKLKSIKTKIYTTFFLGCTTPYLFICVRLFRKKLYPKNEPHYVCIMFEFPDFDKQFENGNFFYFT